MNDANFHCELPEGHKGLHENGLNVWVGWAYHSVEPKSEIQHVQYTPAHSAAKENNGTGKKA